MEVHLKISDSVTLVGKGSTHKEVMKDLSDTYEPFSIDRCGKCKGVKLVPVVRAQGKFTYYELKCADRKCKAKLSYGQSTENGSLYPRRKYHDKHPLVKSGEAKEDDWIPDGGWEQWIPDANAEEGQTIKKAGKK